MLITSGTSSEYEWVFRGIQIYLIIGFIFAERTRWLGESELVILRLSGCADSRSLWADLIGGTATFRTVRGGRRWRRASTRWFIINASRRPPDIIFTLSLSRHSAAGVKKAWAPDTRILQEGQCRGQSESEAQYDTVTTQTHTHISFNELLLTSHTVCAATRSQKEWISKGRWVKTWIYSDLVSRSQISSQLHILMLVGQAGKKASPKARGWVRISWIVPNLIH